MIDLALKVVADALNAHLRAQFPAEQDWIVIAPPEAPEAAGRLALLPITVWQSRMVNSQTKAGARARATPGAAPLGFRSRALLTYGQTDGALLEGFGLLTAAMQWVHAQTTWTPQTNPNLQTDVERFNLKIDSPPTTELCAIFTALQSPLRPALVLALDGVLVEDVDRTIAMREGAPPLE